MASIISPFRQFDSNDALLLMYLANEFSAEDRREVDKAMVGDASLRTQLASLRQLQGSVFAKLASLDAAAPAPAALLHRQQNSLHLSEQTSSETSSETSQAARAAGRWVAAAARRQALAAPRAVSMPAGQSHHMVIGRFRYAIAAAAAALIIGVLAWHPWELPKQSSIVSDVPFVPQQANSLAEERLEQRLDHSFDGSAEAACQTLALANSGLALFSDSSDDRSDGN